MTAGDHEGLVARIRQVRRHAAAREQSSLQTDEPRPERIEPLEARVAHLEQLVEGLQDSVHRESERHAALIAELQNQVQPGTMRLAMAEDIAQETRSPGL